MTCDHPDHTEIDRALVQGQSVSSLAREYGIAPQSLSRHFANHVSKFLQSVSHRIAALEGEQLLAQVVGLVDRAYELLNDAEHGTIKERVAAIREVRGNVELLAKMSMTLSQSQNGLPLGGEDPKEAELNSAIDAALARRGLPAHGPRIKSEEPEVVDAEVVDDVPAEPLALNP